MELSNWFRLFLGVALLASGAMVRAQTTAGAGTVIVVPLVSHSTSFKTEIFVRNPNMVDITLNVRFYDTLLLPAPGQRPCSQFVVPAGRTLSFTLDAQCTFNVANSHFGMVVLDDSANPKLNVFYAFARIQNPSGIGFSAEGFPAGNFSGSNSDVVGLKRQGAAPGYQTNCFVGALGEAVAYSITLFDGATDAAVGSAVTGSLVPYQTVRYLDIFAAAGASAGDHLNVRARFSTSTANFPALVGFCTVQENNTFGADFRIAKSRDALNNREKRMTCYSQDVCGTVSPTSPTQITNASFKNIHTMLIEQPDFVQCQLVSPRLGELQMQLRQPGDVFAATKFVPPAGPYNSGGAGATSFYTFTGDRSTINGGTATRWFIDVSFRSGGTQVVPIDYGITCNSGNGVSVPWYRASAAVDF